jgi:hypothetical protein
VAGLDRPGRLCADAPAGLLSGPSKGRPRSPRAEQRRHRRRRLWIVSLRHGARIKDVRRGLPDLLVFLDEVGWDSRLWQLQRELPGVAARLQALGVGLIPLRPTEAHPPGYVLHHEGWWSFGEDDIDEPLFLPAGPRVGEGGLLSLHAAEPGAPPCPRGGRGSIMGGCGA